MSAKYTYFAWQTNIPNPAEKLLLLLLADYANESGMTTVCLTEVCHLCSMTEMGMANCLTSFAEQGYIERIRRDGNGRNEALTFKLLISLSNTRNNENTSDMMPVESVNHSQPQVAQGNQADPNSAIPVYSMREPTSSPFPASSQYAGSKRSEGNAISTYDLDENIIPTWAERAFRFSGIANDHTVVWRNFVLHHRARANELMTISRIESKLQNWLTNEKRYERQQTGRSTTPGDGGKAQTAGYKQKLSPSERFRQQVIQKGHKPKF